MSALIAVPFAAALTFAAWCYRELRACRTRIERLRADDDAILHAVRSFVDASRVSSALVIERLDETLRTYDPAIDVVLAFKPKGDELACEYATGERATHYSCLRLRRDAVESLPSRAAIAGHRIIGEGGALIPTDRQALAVPMHDGDGLRAVIYVSSAKSAAIASEDVLVRTIQHAGSPYGVAIAREADRIEATYDGLTGLLSARAFRVRLTEEIDRARMREGTLWTLWFVDTDHFKSVNDQRGHAAGDVALQSMAEILRTHTIRDVDILGRNGGDEFCALIAGTQKIVAIERAQRLCEAVRNYNFGAPQQLTASIGVASFPYDARTASELLEVADAAMYYSKRTGRDRVSFSVHGTSFATYR
ncbi:MAG: GGDEF domain-containing protein [Candidatus Eremiobacteraeota bacterium]|nr:GGDEF domain-containing protein [Candidatus Eremiobacteraeota bacterium]